MNAERLLNYVVAQLWAMRFVYKKIYSSLMGFKGKKTAGYVIYFLPVIFFRKKKKKIELSKI